MKIFDQLKTGAVSQLRNVWKLLVFSYLPIILIFLVAAVTSSMVEGVSVHILLRDVTATAKVPIYTGIVSQLGLILWSAVLTVCVFGLVVLRAGSLEFAGARRFLLHGSLLTMILLLDDSFLFHEEIAPDYLNIGEKFVFLAYLIIGVIVFLLNWREILASEYILFFLALALFGGSLFLDEIPLYRLDVQDFLERLELLMEDGFKFAGIVTWLLYFVRFTNQKMASMYRAAGA